MVEQITHPQTQFLAIIPSRTLGLRCSDIGNAEVFAQQQKDRLRYSSLGQWLYWDDTAWRTDVEIQLDRLAEETVCSFLSEASEIMTAQIAMISLNGLGGQVADKDRGQWSNNLDTDLKSILMTLIEIPRFSACKGERR